MAWHQPGDKPLSEPMLVFVLTHICVTRPQWVKRDVAQMHQQLSYLPLPFFCTKPLNQDSLDIPDGKGINNNGYSDLALLFNTRPIDVKQTVFRCCPVVKYFLTEIDYLSLTTGLYGYFFVTQCVLVMALIFVNICSDNGSSYLQTALRHWIRLWLDAWQQSFWISVD